MFENEKNLKIFTTFSKLSNKMRKKNIRIKHAKNIDGIPSKVL